MLFLFGFPIPLGVAVWLGLRAGRQNPHTPAEFIRIGAYYVIWAIALIFLWHALWIASLIPAHWPDTLRSATEWTLGTGTIWLPIFGITYVLRAMYMRKKDP